MNSPWLDGSLVAEPVAHGLLLLVRVSVAVVSARALCAIGPGWPRGVFWVLPAALCAWPLSTLQPEVARDPGSLFFHAAIGEAWLGGWLALGLTAPVLAIRWAGGWLDPLWGDVIGALPGAPFERLFAPLAVALFAGLGGLRVAAGCFFGTFATHPLGAFAGASPWPLVRLVADAMGWALLIAGPVLLAYLLSTLALGLFARVASPHGTPWLAALPLRALLLICTVLLTLAGVADAVPDHVTAALAVVQQAAQP